MSLAQTEEEEHLQQPVDKEASYLSLTSSLQSCLPPSLLLSLSHTLHHLDLGWPHKQAVVFRTAEVFFSTDGAIILAS